MKKQIIVAVVAIGLMGLIWFLATNKSGETVADDMFTQGDPLELTLELMSLWRDNLVATTTVPLATFLEQPLFSQQLRTSLLATPRAEDAPDALLCQTTIPPRVVGRKIAETNNEAQVMVIARGQEERSPFQAIVTLRGNGEGGWLIDAISCAEGESAPEVEFSFDREGFLLKSVPPPYQAGNWHIVFEQDGQMGYVAPIEFNAESICIEENGTESVCAPDTLVEPVSALVRGDMTEAGVIVRQVRFGEI